MATLSFKQYVSVSATAADVWCFIEDPDMVKLWNPKLTETTLGEGDRFVQGSHFSATYSMRGKSRQVEVEVIECNEPHRMVLSYSGGCLPEGGKAVETITLTKKDDHTVVERHVAMTDVGIPWWARISIRLLSWFGRPVCETNLETLKQLVEDTSSAAELQPALSTSNN